MSRFILQIFAIKSRIVEKQNKCKSFLVPNFFRRETPTFLRQIVSAIYRPPFGKVWLSSVRWSQFVEPGNEVECRIYGGWVKTHLQFEAVCGPKFMSFWNYYCCCCCWCCTKFNVPCQPEVTNRRHGRTVTWWSEVERVVVGFLVVGFKCRLKTSRWIEIVSYVERQRVPRWRSSIAKSSVGENITGTICVQLSVLTWL